MQQNDVSYFWIHSVSLCVFIGGLNPLMLRDINNQFCVCMCERGKRGREG